MVILKINFALIFTFSLQMAFTQIYVEQTTGRPQHEATTVSVYGPDASNKKIPFSRINGSPFWKEEWQLASLYDKNAQRINIVPARLNLATNELHFMWKEQELVAGDNDKISLIIFHTNNDTTSIGPMFIKNIPDLAVDRKPLNAFVRLMNKGNCQLLKYTNRRVYPGEDSLFGTQKRYIFRDINFYFLKTGNKVVKIKKLNNEHFLALIPEAALYKEWINENNLNFKKEEDLVFFLNYFNAQINSSRQ